MGTLVAAVSMRPLDEIMGKGTSIKAFVSAFWLITVSVSIADAEPCGASLNDCTECLVAQPNIPLRVDRHWVTVVEIQFTAPGLYPPNGLFFNKTRWVAECDDAHNIALCEQVHWGKSADDVLRSAFAGGLMKLNPDIFARGQCRSTPSS